MKNILIVLFLFFGIISVFSNNNDSEIITEVKIKTQDIESNQETEKILQEKSSESIQINFESEKIENKIVQKVTNVESQVIKSSNNSCNPNYSGCLKINAGDYDCRGGSGNGPNYTGKVKVLGYDEFGLDRDNDGRGCE